MIGQILRAITGTPATEGEQSGSGRSLLVIGIILFVLLGGLRLLQKPEETAAEEE